MELEKSRTRAISRDSMYAVPEEVIDTDLVPKTPANRVFSCPSG